MASVVACIAAVLGSIPIRLSDIIYRCKWIATYWQLRIYRRQNKGRLNFYDIKAKEQPEKTGFVTHPIELELESPYPESHLVKADDEILCYGVNSKTECLLVSVSRLSDETADATVYLRLATGKTYQAEYNSDFQQPNNEKHVFSCGGLQMHYTTPMRRWRIFFSGYLRETSAENPDVHKMIYVKFSFLWRAAADVYDNTADMNGSRIVESVAKADWKTYVPPINELHHLLDYYAQPGVIRGTVYVEDTLEDYEMYLFGERFRYLGSVSRAKESEFSLTLGYVHKNGIYLHFGEATSTNIAKNITYGYLLKPTIEMKNVETVDVSETSIDANNHELKGTIVAERSYAFCASTLKAISQESSKDTSLSMHLIKFYLNGKGGTGLHIKGKFNATSSRRTLDVKLPTKVPELPFPMVVSFTEELCQLSEITGGKGSSLGKLTHISAEQKTFTVPSGVVVTTSSYKEFINRDILAEIGNLEKVLYGNTGDAKEACRRLQDKVIAARVPNNISDNIVKILENIYGEKYSSKKFAIRSSATGEDTEQMSAAGQMDTFLGVSGLNNILEALRKCWASQFGFTAVQYKRRYGQCINTPMAVVIQEMVSCDVAGVLFTCDPVSGNPTKMSIAANFGLGESVVSGSEEPDSIELDRNYEDELTIHRVTVGSKKHRIVQIAEGTGVEDIPENQRLKCCLSPEKALQLGKIAIKIEKYCRTRRDIEWGLRNDELYIFQSRPVTSGTQETDFEIEHELDGPLRVEKDHFSVSNLGEVMPGAMTPLTIDVFYRMNAIVWQGDLEIEWQTPIKAKYFPLGMMTMYNHAMFNIDDMFNGVSSASDMKDDFLKATMIAIFGRILDDEDLFEVAIEKFAAQDKKKPTLMGMYRMIKKISCSTLSVLLNVTELNYLQTLLFSGGRLKIAKKQFDKYRIPVENYTSAVDLYHALTLRCADFCHPVMTHMICSQASTAWNMMILTSLAKADNIDSNVYSDFANLITNKGDVESADVPSAIQSLAFHITKSIQPKKFKEMKTEDALEWLRTTQSSAGKKFKEFIDKHGHRCLKEFDMYSKTWGTHPEPLVKLLQNLAGQVTEDAADVKSAGVLELISQLKIPIGLLTKLKLMLLIPLSRKAVRERESSKSLYIKLMDAWRKAYLGLAKLMVAEGRIPDENIMFFMTLAEVKELLDTRSPKVLAKAYHRQRLYPKMDKYIFPEMMSGFPKPINYSEKLELNESDFSMKGLPVSQGVAKGYVRVALSLDDAAELKPGEILLAYSTDIGWTPYFPTLAGVATELGGLISHGAVVSREYGLPCIAGLHGATRRFKTGDYVLLDGNKGLLQKIPHPES